MHQFRVTSIKMFLASLFPLKFLFLTPSGFAKTQNVCVASHYLKWLPMTFPAWQCGFTATASEAHGFFGSPLVKSPFFGSNCCFSSSVEQSAPFSLRLFMLRQAHCWATVLLAIAKTGFILCNFTQLNCSPDSNPPTRKNQAHQAHWKKQWRTYSQDSKKWHQETRKHTLKALMSVCLSFRKRLPRESGSDEWSSLILTLEFF